MRQAAPGTAGPHMIEDGVDQLAVGIRPGTAACFRRGDQMRNVLPLQIGQVGGI